METATAHDTAPGGPKRLAFIVTEDWFFASHFLPMARAAREVGLEVAVIARVREHRAAIEAAGAKVIALEAERRSLNPCRGRLLGRPARGDPQGLEARHRPLHRAAPDPDRRRGGADGRHSPSRVRAHRHRLPRRAARSRRRRCAKRDPHAGARPGDEADALPFREPRRRGAARARSGRQRAGDDPRRRRGRCRSSSPGAAAAAAAAEGRGCRPHALVEGHRPRGRGREARPGEGRPGRAVALRRARPFEPEGDPGRDPARLEWRARYRLARADRGRRRGLARASRLLPALAGGRGAAAHASRRRGLRTRARHDRRAGLPHPGARRHRGASSCRRTMRRRWPTPS